MEETGYIKTEVVPPVPERIRLDIPGLPSYWDGVVLSRRDTILLMVQLGDWLGGRYRVHVQLEDQENLGIQLNGDKDA